jgi:hypothetical protein
MSARVELSALSHGGRVGLPAQCPVLVNVVVVEVETLLLLELALLSLVLLERALDCCEVVVELVELALGRLEIALDFVGGCVGLVNLPGGVVNPGLNLDQLGPL